MMVRDLRAEGVDGDDAWLRLLLHALPQQLEAAFASTQCELKQKVERVQRAHDVWINPTDNWFTQNASRLGGGFDMQKLTATPGLLASKFTRLSSKCALTCTPHLPELIYCAARTHPARARISLLNGFR